MNVDQLHVASLSTAVVEMAVVFALLAVVALLARRRRDREVVTLAIVAVVAIGLGWYTVAQITTKVVGVSSHTFRIMWSVAAFTTFALALGVVRRLGRGAMRHVVPVLTVAVVVVSIATLPAAASSGGAQVDDWAVPVVRSIDRQLGALRPDAPVLADWPGIGYADPYSFAFDAEMRRRDIPFVVSDRYLVRQFGPDRKYDGHNARSRVFYELGPAARVMMIGSFRRIAFHDGLGADDRAALRRLSTAAQDALVRGAITAAPGLDGARNLGLFHDLAFPVTDPGAAKRAVDSGQVANAWEGHLIRAPAPVARALAALAHLQERVNRATVGVFVGPVDARTP